MTKAEHEDPGICGQDCFISVNYTIPLTEVFFLSISDIFAEKLTDSLTGKSEHKSSTSMIRVILLFIHKD